MFIGGMQRIKKGHQRLDLRRGKIFAEGRHIAAARHHFKAQLVRGHSRGNIVEGWPALASNSADGVAIAALLILEDILSLPHQG